MQLTFSDTRVLIIGDIMLDEYVTGTAARLSPEAPVPIMLIDGKKSYTYNLGGAGNVAANVTSLSGQAQIVGIVGSTDDGTDTILDLCREHRIDYRAVIGVLGRQTTIKTRIIANGQQIARIDCENTDKLTEQAENALLERIRKCIPGCSAVVISDYAKGVVSENVFETTLWLAYQHGKPVFIDPKVANLSQYLANNEREITCFTPNLHEAEGLSGLKITDFASLEAAGKRILSQFGAKYILITRGNDGMSLFSSVPYSVSHFPTRAKAVFDVSGAGDTVIATLALAYGSGYSMESAVVLANAAAGITVGKRGTSTVSLEELSTDKSLFCLTKLP